MTEPMSEQSLVQHRNTSRSTARDLISAFAETDTIDDTYLVFGVAAECYGIKIEFVTEVVGIQPIRPAPDVPAFVKGFINLRGAVIPVMDLRLRFGVGDASYGEKTVIIILKVDDVRMGLIVDEVVDVVELPPKDIDASPRAAESSTSPGVVQGIGKLTETLAIILDVRALIHQ